VSRSSLKPRLPLRLLASGLGVLLFAYLVRRAGPAMVLASMRTLGWGLALVMAWGGVAHIVKALAWRLTLLNEKRLVSFGRLLGLRLASEALGQLGGVAQLFGEGLRVSLLGPAMPLDRGIASVTLDRVFFVVSAAVVSTAGLLAVLIVLPLPHRLAVYACLFAGILGGVVLVAAFAVRKRWPVLSWAAKILGRARYFRNWIERERSLIHSVEKNLLGFYHDTPGLFWATFALNLACHGAAVIEVYLILRLMGANIGLFEALAIEALTKLVNIVGTFNPGNIGTYEGGSMVIVRMFDLTAAAGLTLAFVRRLRALFWSAMGALCMVILVRRRKQSIQSGENMTQIEPEPISPNDVVIRSELHPAHTAVILANHLGGIGFNSPLPEVGAVPVLLRSILGAAKAGAARIVVVIDRTKGPWLQRDLRNTGRLPNTVEWCEVIAGEEYLPLLLGHLASKANGLLVLIAGDRVYQSSLQTCANEWDGEGNALALVTGGEPVGICLLRRETAMELSRRCPAVASSIGDVLAWLSLTHSVEREPVPEEKWQRIHNEKERLVAEKKLDGWLVKPTDGIFARANRRISIPISRRIIPYSITPNMVSVFTLGVSFAGGVFLAFGGYWNMLMGAVLSWLSSVLDGCDGEVARLKLQESTFGCWLETICDNLYYLFTFGGLTIGLIRMTGNRAYLVWGGCLLLGAVMSFMMTGIQRHQLANGRPERYLLEWHTKADSRSSNPLLYLGRHTEFIIRRCFLPYVILIFALFGVMNWFLVGATVGANIVWIVALYSLLAFTPPRTIGLQGSPLSVRQPRMRIDSP
jgi:phosphatidylglycerophosphate synthase